MRLHLTFAWGHPGLALVRLFECGRIVVLQGHGIDLAHRHVGLLKEYRRPAGCLTRPQLVQRGAVGLQLVLWLICSSDIPVMASSDDLVGSGELGSHLAARSTLMSRSDIGCSLTP